MKIVLFYFFRFTFRCFDRFHMVISIVSHAKTAWQPSMRTISFISFTFSFLRRERIRQNPLNWRRRWYWWWWWWGHTLWDRYIHTDEFICIKLEWANLSKCPSFSHIDSIHFCFTLFFCSTCRCFESVRFVCSVCITLKCAYALYGPQIKWLCDERCVANEFNSIYCFCNLMTEFTKFQLRFCFTARYVSAREFT